MSAPRPMTLREFVALRLIRTAAFPVGNGEGLSTLELEDALAGAVEELRQEGWRIDVGWQRGRRFYRLIAVPEGVIDPRRAAR